MASLDIGVLDVFALPFMGRALLTIVVLAIAAGIIGVSISFRELEFVSDGLVHAVFPGLVIGAMLGGSAWLLPGAAGAAVIAAILFTVLERAGGVTTDAAIAVVLTGLFSLGVVLVSRQEGYVSQLQELLFGRLLTVTDEQVWQIAIVAAVAITIVLVTWRAQLYRAFDATGFAAAGFSVLATDLWLSVAIALLVVAGVQALGVLMVIALLTVPMAVARLVTRRFVLLIPIAIAVPLVSGALGLWVSFDLSVRAESSVSPGALVVLILVALYGVAVLVRMAMGRVLARRVTTERIAGSRTAGPSRMHSRRGVR